MTLQIKNRIVLVAFLLVSMTTNAQVGSTLKSDSVSISNSNYSEEYENALKRKDELTTRKKTLNDSIKDWNRELKRLKALHASIVRANEKLERKIALAEERNQKFGLSELLRERERLLIDISEAEKEIALLESQLQEVDAKLQDRNHQREDLGKIKDNVSNQIIMENKDYLEFPFSHMELSELRQIKSKCLKYSTDVKVNAFVQKIDNMIKNKELYDNMFNVVNSPYKKYDVDRALASISLIKGSNMLQQKEISDLKTQLTLFPEGLIAFKEFIAKLNEMRSGVSYSLEYFKTDSKQILSRNNLGNRIENQLKRVPYLNKKFEEFMNAFKAAPNKHSSVETEIINQ